MHPRGLHLRPGVWGGVQECKGTYFLAMRNAFQVLVNVTVRIRSFGASAKSLSSWVMRSLINACINNLQSTTRMLKALLVCTGLPPCTGYEDEFALAVARPSLLLTSDQRHGAAFPPSSH